MLLKNRSTVAVVERVAAERMMPEPALPAPERSAWVPEVAAAASLWKSSSSGRSNASFRRSWRDFFFFLLGVCLPPRPRGADLLPGGLPPRPHLAAQEPRIYLRPLRLGLLWLLCAVAETRLLLRRGSGFRAGCPAPPRRIAASCGPLLHLRSASSRLSAASLAEPCQSGSFPSCPASL